MNAHAAGMRRVAPRRELVVIGLAQALLVNSVTLLGVYQFGWPVATGLALYWAENLLTGLILIATTAMWLRANRGSAGGLPVRIGDLTTMTLVFAAGHFVFLAAFLVMILPKVAPAERFDIHSCLQGLAVLVVLMVLGFVRLVWQVHTNGVESLGRAISLFTSRLVVLHFTILLGMAALAVFGQARAFFAVFAGLKVLADALDKRAEARQPA